MSSRAARTVPILLLVLLLAVACGSAPAERLGPAAHPPTQLPSFAHVFVVVMENLGYRQAIAVPGLAKLMHRYAYASESYAVTHPSLPNYLALTAGTTFGVTSDCWFCYVHGPNLATLLERSHVSWAAYMEGLPGTGWLGPYWPFTGYAGKHDPFRYFDDVRASRSLADHIQPLTRLLPLLSGPATRVPRFVWVTPNLCHDGHDCPAAEAATWLDGFVARLTRSAAWRQHGVLFVTWDEGSGGDARAVDPHDRIVPTGGGGHILTLVIAPDLPAGLHVAVPLNHYSLLKTIEEAFHLPLIGATDDRELPSFSVFWQRSGR
jgi:hypothetical protein